MNQSPDLETLVLANLGRSLEMYQALNKKLDHMLTGVDGLDSIESQAQQIRDFMTEITAHEQQSQAAIRQYRDANDSASEPVKQITSRLGDLMQNVLLKISRLENGAQKSRQLLLPQIRNEAKVVQMKSAYNQYL